MKTTIRADLHTQVTTCCVCGDQAEIPRRLLRDQHNLMLFVDGLTADHRECLANPDNPSLARLSRAFRKGVQREERRTATYTASYKRAA